MVDSARRRADFRPSQADTPGCTSQACGYRDVHDEIGDLGYDVYGLSKDKPAAQKKVNGVDERAHYMSCC